MRGGGVGVGVKGNKGSDRLRVGSWNIKTLMGKSIQFLKILKKRKMNITQDQQPLIF